MSRHEFNSAHPGPESAPNHEKPLAGAVYVCIGASRPDKSIGGPTAVALAQAGADVLITGADPSKARKAEQVLQSIGEAGSTASGYLQCNLAGEGVWGMWDLLNEIKSRYGQVDGVLYYPAGGLVGEDDEKRAKHGRILNEIAPFTIANQLLSRGMIKKGGFFQMTPSIYSWMYPNIPSPDPQYDVVARTKHEGELAMHALTPEFQSAGVSLVYTVAHGVEGTFVMRLMTKDMSPEQYATMLHSAQMENGERRAPTIQDMAQASVRVAQLARQGSLPTVHTEWVGVSPEAQASPDRFRRHLDSFDVRLDHLYMYGLDADFVYEAQVFGNGRRVIAEMRDDGIFKPDVLGGQLELGGYEGRYVVTEADVKGHFDAASGLPSVFPGYKSIALARAAVEHVSPELGAEATVDMIQLTDFHSPVGVGAELQTEVSQVYSMIGADVTVSRAGKKVATCGFLFSKEIPKFEADKHIAPEYLIEAAAQALLIGMQTANNTEEQLLPLFASIGAVNIYQQIPLKSKCTIDVRSESDEAGFSGNARIYTADGTLAVVIDDMRGKVVPVERAKRYLRKALQ